MPIPINEIYYIQKTAKEKVYETIREWIIEGKLKTSEKICIEEMARYFGVSRTPVREALQLLELQKLIMSFPGKSTIVSEIETNNIEQWYMPMVALQKLAINIAVEKANADDVENLIILNKEFEKEVNIEDNALKRMYADKKFHDEILKIADNEYIIDFSETLWIHILRLEYAYFKDGENFEESIIDHNEMINAIKLKDGFTASLAMERNWTNTVIMLKYLISNKYI